MNMSIRNKLITRPESKVDRVILCVLVMLTVFHFNTWLENLDMLSGLKFLTSLGFGVMVSFFISALYWNVHSEVKQLARLRHKTLKYLYTPSYEGLKESKVLKLIEDICKATIVPIEERKPLFDDVCNFFIDFFPDHTIPESVTLMWKKAIIEYKKYEIWND